MFGGEEPPSHRFNAGEKLVLWGGVVVLGSIVIVSGFVLDKVVPGLETTRGDMQIAHIVHAIAAMLIMRVFLGHIYMGTIGMRGAYQAMKTGYVDEGWAREHHRLWYDDIVAGKIPAQRTCRAAASSSPPRDGVEKENEPMRKVIPLAAVVAAGLRPAPPSPSCRRSPTTPRRRRPRRPARPRGATRSAPTSSASRWTTSPRNTGRAPLPPASRRRPPRRRPRAPTPALCAGSDARGGKPLEASEAHSPAGMATSPPSSKATSAEMTGPRK